jgi:phage shock protein A
MALLERVATLLRANINDLIDRAEDPIKMLNQVILDMENQLLQVKTQLAIAIADLHLLDKRREENRAREQEWVRRADLAIGKQDDGLARSALERSLAARDIAASFEQQIGDGKVQAENLRNALTRLEAKLTETRVQAELLKSQHRRARAAGNAADAVSRRPISVNGIQDKVEREAALAQAKTDLVADESLEERFAALEKQEEIERLLTDLKARRLQ